MRNEILHRTPEQAAAELANAIRSNDLKHIHSVLGPGSGKVIHSGDPVLDAAGRKRFLEAYETSPDRTLGRCDGRAADRRGGVPLPIPAGETGDRLEFRLEGRSRGSPQSSNRTKRTLRDPGVPHYKILTGQGADNPGGAYSYVVRGKLIGGFALVAYPARWGASGVMTFICNHQGVVYEKNLGKGTVAIAERMTRYNPDASWKKTDE